MAKTAVAVEVRDPKDNVIEQLSLTSNEMGSVTGDFELALAEEVGAVEQVVAVVVAGPAGFEERPGEQQGEGDAGQEHGREERVRDLVAEGADLPVREQPQRPVEPGEPRHVERPQIRYPAWATVSLREPVRTQKPSAIERTDGNCSVTTRTPEPSSVSLCC